MESTVRDYFSHMGRHHLCDFYPLYIRIRFGLVQQVVALIFSAMEFVREITFTEEEPLSRLQQLTGEYNAVFQYVCQIITDYINTWSMPYQEGMQSATIYLSFLCKDGKVMPMPVRMEVRVLRIEVESFAERKLNELLQNYDWEKK